MRPRVDLLGRSILVLLVQALVASCASSASARRDDELLNVTRRQQAVASRDGLAPALTERATIQRAVEDYLKEVAKQQQTRGTIIHVSGADPVIPMYECMEFGCPPTVLCKRAGAVCSVTHCGQGSCHSCPMPVPESFKNLIFKQWCQYECFRGPLRLGPVIGFVPAIGTFFAGPLGCEFLRTP